MESSKVTIKEVARESGVSITTVSRYLNGNFGSMSAETKDRIRDVIERLNYHPNKMAQGLKGQSRTIAVVVVNIGYPFCVSVIRSISDVLNDYGYSLMVCETGGNTKKEHTLLISLMAQGVDGIIIQTNGDNNALLEKMAQTLPIVFIDRDFEIFGTLSVVTNNQDASLELTEAIFKEGYEQVIYVSEDLRGISTRIERHAGYLQACERMNRDAAVLWVDRENIESFHGCVKEMGYRKRTPFAVYTANGLIMLELYPLLTELPFDVPSKMGLATFDEPDWVNITSPTLTCVRQPTTEIGYQAASAVLEQLSSVIPSQENTRNVHTIPSKVVWSNSTRLKR